MKANTFNTGCPVVRESNEVFVQHVTVGTERRRLEHTQRILWIAESEAQMQFLHGGAELKTGSTFNDFYGFCTSFQRLEDDLAALCQRYSITADSTLELIVLATLFHTPAIETEEDKRENAMRASKYNGRHKRQYTSVPDDWRQMIPNPNFGKDGDTQEFYWPSLKPRIITSAVAWSSKNTPEENARVAANLIKEWSEKQ